jgi:predicted Na+-dependent transporter
MTFLFSRCTPGPDGTLVIPAKLVSLWRNMSAQSWETLWPAEKDTDRQQAKALEEAIDGNPSS